MLEVTLRKPALDVESQYSGKGVQFSAIQAICTLQYAFNHTITTKIIERTGPQYDGELEHFVLNPLVELSKAVLKSPSTGAAPLIKAMMARAISYGVCDQVLKVYEIREVARNLTTDMLKTSDIYKMISNLNDEAVKPVDAETSQDEDRSLDANKAPKPLRAIRAWIVDRNQASKAERPFKFADADQWDGLDVIQAEFFGSQSNQVAKDALDSEATIYRDLVQFAKSGKGMALKRSGRAKIADKLSYVRAAVRALFAYAINAPAGEDRMEPALAGMALGTALLEYLKMAEDPDTYFPRQELQFNVVAWASGLKAEAGVLKNFWLYHAIAPATFTVTLAQQLWQKEISWMSFMGEEFTVLKQARELLDKEKDHFEVVRCEFYEDLAQRLIEDVKRYNRATEILPLNVLYSERFEEVLSAAMKKAASMSPSWSYGSSTDDNLKEVAPTPMLQIPFEDKQWASEQMAMQAQNIIDAMALAVRSTQFISLSLDDLQPVRPLVPMHIDDLQWPEIRSAGEDDYLTFSMPSIMSPAVEKWSGRKWTTTSQRGQADNFTSQWVWEPRLYQMFRPLSARWELLKNQEPLMMWDTRQVPEVLGDAITRPWGMQPTFAAYTYSRNRNWQPLTMAAYLQMMQGAIDGIPHQDYLKHAAQIIAAYGADDPLTQSIIDYLAPVMSVRIIAKKGQSATTQYPSLRTLYGVESHAFIDENIKRITTDEALARSYEMSDPQGRTVTVEFHLHTVVPKPREVMPFLQTLDTGLSCPAMVSRELGDNFFKDKKSSFAEYTERNGMLDAILRQTDSPEWVDALGLSPFKLWMPATYFDVFTRSSLFSSQFDVNEIAYAYAAAVKWRVNPVTGALQLRGFVHNPVCLLEFTDMLSAEQCEDPIPEAPGLRKPENVAEGTEAPGSPEGPAPDGLRPESTKDAVRRGSDTLKIPAVAMGLSDGAQKAVFVNPEPASEPETIMTREDGKFAGKRTVDKGSPLIGDPQRDDVDAERDASVAAEVWVVVEEDGKTILRKVKKDQVPNGARLASDEEVAKWLKEQGDESK
jgi:hypothetical protein